LDQYYNIGKVKFKKITGTTISDLAGLNRFNKRGDIILKQAGIITEHFDEFYTKRGAIAEKIVKQWLIKNGKKPTTYNAQELQWDNFHEDNKFGGLIDIELIEDNTLYEVKSKNIKDYDKICKYGDAVQEEQAMHYGYMRKYDKVYIIWIFFDDKTEEEIRNDLPITTLKNLKMFRKELNVDRKYQDTIHYNAYIFYTQCLKEERIPISDISEKYYEELGIKKVDDIPMDFDF
jgi:hypothetical protein